MRALRPFVSAGITCLVVIPMSGAVAGTLREEAIGYRLQGFEAQEQGDDARALMSLQKAAAMDPSYPAPQNDIGVIRERQGRLDEAERAYKAALAVDPGYLPAHANLAMLYERMGRKEPAVYHWLKRYQLGDGADPWTIRAEERLHALGVLELYPGLKGKLYTRRKVVSEAFDAFEQSRSDFHAITKQHGDWP